MTPVGLLERFQQSAGALRGVAPREVGSPPWDGTFAATIRAAHKPQPGRETPGDAPRPQPRLPDDGSEPAPAAERPPTEAAPQLVSSGTLGEQGHQTAAPPGNASPMTVESVGQTADEGQPAADTIATPTVASAPAQQGALDWSAVGSSILWRLGRNVLTFSGVQRAAAPSGAAAPPGAPGQPRPLAEARLPDGATSEAPLPMPQRVAIRALPLPAGPDTDAPTGSSAERGRGDTAATPRQLVPSTSDVPEARPPALDVPGRPPRDERIPGVEGRSPEQPVPVHGGARASSPAAEVVRFLVPEADSGKPPDRGRLSGEPIVVERAERGGDRPVHLAPLEPAEVMFRSARVVDAHDSLAQRLVGDTGETEPASPVERLTRVLASTAGPRTSYLKLQLEPPQLGQIRLEVRLNQDGLSIRVQAESPAVRDVLADRAGDLRTALEQQGLHVDRLSVEVRAFASNANGGSEETNQRQAGDHGQSASHEQSNSHSEWSRRAGDWGNDPGAGGEAAFEPQPSQAEADDVLVTTESSVDVFV